MCCVVVSGRSLSFAESGLRRLLEAALAVPPGSRPANDPAIDLWRDVMAARMRGAQHLGMPYVVVRYADDIRSRAEYLTLDLGRDLHWGYRAEDGVACLGAVAPCDLALSTSLSCCDREPPCPHWLPVWILEGDNAEPARSSAFGVLRSQAPPEPQAN